MNTFRVKSARMSDGDPRQAGLDSMGPTGKEDEAFAEEARRILRSAMERRGYSFASLARVLNSQPGAQAETAQTLSNKVNRGRFTFAFFIRVARAMDVMTLSIAPLDSAPSDATVSEQPAASGPR